MMKTSLTKAAVASTALVVGTLLLKDTDPHASISHED
jgi:hypothetical protein